MNLHGSVKKGAKTLSDSKANHNICTRIIHFLIAIGFIPVTVENETVKLSYLSRKFWFYILFYCNLPLIIMVISVSIFYGSYEELITGLFLSANVMDIGTNLFYFGSLLFVAPIINLLGKAPKKTSTILMRPDF